MKILAETKTVTKTLKRLKTKKRQDRKSYYDLSAKLEDTEKSAGQQFFIVIFDRKDQIQPQAFYYNGF